MFAQAFCVRLHGYLNCSIDLLWETCLEVFMLVLAYYVRPHEQGHGWLKCSSLCSYLLKPLLGRIPSLLGLPLVKLFLLEVVQAFSLPIYLCKLEQGLV